MVNNRLQPILQQAPSSPHASDLIKILGQSEVVHQLFSNQTGNFYPVVVGQPAGIHRTKCMTLVFVPDFILMESALSSLQGFAFPCWQEMPTFWDALAFMIVKGIKELLPDAPNDEGAARILKCIQPVLTSVVDDPPILVPTSNSEGTPTPIVNNPSCSAADCGPSISNHCPIVYTHVCNLHGVIESRLYASEWDSAPESAAEALGIHAMKYLEAHGYIKSAVANIVVVYLTSHTELEFALSMARNGLPLAESFFLWYLFHL
ncbi:hypothetical protein EDD16DRAFT_1724556 [Pisolithus croceorrhizus]|nr:hypothetical protein EDD16DRAFT_1724556 [Pisolithus croceorrhizus]KAI6159392.1 hypothetical protein EDD17DRAFT_1898792 [Pisolithus thermaeus]